MKIENDLMSIILPGRIVEYFPEDQTATIQVCAELVTHTTKQNNVNTVRKPIVGIPVVTSGGGGYHQTFPIKEGDTCILYFSQVGYDHWMYNDEDVAGLLESLPETWLYRQFSEDDGFALVGLNTIPRAITEYQTDRAEFRNGTRETRISILDDGSIEAIAGDDTTLVMALNGDTTVSNGGTTITMKQGGNVEIVAQDTVAIDGNVTVTGDIDCQGTVTGVVDTFGGGISLLNHTHEYIKPAHEAGPIDTAPPT